MLLEELRLGDVVGIEDDHEVAVGEAHRLVDVAGLGPPAVRDRSDSRRRASRRARSTSLERPSSSTQTLLRGWRIAIAASRVDMTISTGSPHTVMKMSTDSRVVEKSDGFRFGPPLGRNRPPEARRLRDVEQLGEHKQREQPDHLRTSIEEEPLQVQRSRDRRGDRKEYRQVRR